MTVLAMANYKGGVAKTTSVLNIGAALAEIGKRVLLADLDSSADLTYSAGIDLSDDDTTVYDVLTGRTTISESVWTLTDDLGSAYDVLPADSAVLGLREAVREMPRPQYRLRDALQTVADDYDYVLLDTPPLADMAAIQALVAAEGIIAPAQPHALSVTALTNLALTVKDVRELNPALQIDGILLTSYNARSRHHGEIRDAIEQAMPGKLLETSISTAIGVTEAAAARTNIFEYSRKTPARKQMRALGQYRAAANEIVQRKENT